MVANSFFVSFTREAAEVPMPSRQKNDGQGRDVQEDDGKKLLKFLKRIEY